MKTFEQIVDELWKPVNSLITSKRNSYKDCCNIREYGKRDTYPIYYYSIDRSYHYAKTLMQPFYGKDVGEPIVKICKRILDKPRRFHPLKWDYQSIWVGVEGFAWKSEPTVLILQDKDTQAKFVVGNQDEIRYPTFLTKDEQTLLYTVISEWKCSELDRLESKKNQREQKRKEKFRKEMVDIYKDY